MGTLDGEQLNFGPIHMAIEFWLLDLKTYLDGELNLI
jgi:hypothetical protein